MDTSRSTKKEVVTAFRTKEILAAARRLMEQEGVETVTMDGIAQAAGVAKGTIYLYFQGKDELIQALMSEVGDGLALDLEAILERPEPPREKLKRAAKLLLDYVEQERILFPIYLRELVRSKATRGFRAQTFQALEDRIVGLITRLFAEGIAQRQFIPADPRLLAYLLKGLGRAVGYYQMTVGPEGAVREALPVLLTLLFSGLGLPPAGVREEEAL